MLTCTGTPFSTHSDMANVGPLSTLANRHWWFPQGTTDTANGGPHPLTRVHRKKMHSTHRDLTQQRQTP